MAENNRVGQQDDPIPPVVSPPHNQAAQPRLRDIQRPVITVNPSCIQLSDAARNYELKTFHLNMLPTFNGLGSEDALGFMRELYSMSLVDTAAGGYTGDKNSDELETIYENLASNSRQKAVRSRRAVVHEISTQSELTTQMAELTKQINLLKTRDSSNREFCAFCNTYGHNSSVCMNAESSQPSYEEANYMGSNMGRQQPRSDPFSNTYNPGWRNHPNFSWRDQGNARQMGPLGFQQQGPSGFQHQQYRPFQQAPAPQQPQLPTQEKKPQLEEMFMQYMASQDTMMEKMDAKIDKVAQSNQASIHNLEVQVGQLAKLVAEKDQGKLPSTTEINPREGAMAVTLRSGKILDDALKEKEPMSVEKESDKEDEQVPKESSSDQNLTSSTINIPFAEALANMPSYAKYIKEIMSNKKKLEEFATVHLNEECSAILQSKLPPKLMDPGSFSIPCTIGNTVVDKCLCDLGASINLMPLTLFNKLEIAEMKPTTISLQLADRSIKYPHGVVEDILVKVGKFYFPGDFLILDMGSDTDTSLILGKLKSRRFCPFMVTKVCSYEATEIERDKKRPFMVASPKGSPEEIGN
ncbi:PREDICTED: uncharacterized protein LOC109178859 [Ipomoea nil]|uniref:uncharacterized protein LOC109178859 n=1 Tax=Ipomoea nil TaxID=35883 RepID=UPI0009013EBD|nr:PREDICTED: uncharacterized protein LOC109178859 [Ipomoea nil]